MHDVHHSAEADLSSKERGEPATIDYSTERAFHRGIFETPLGMCTKFA